MNYQELLERSQKELETLKTQKAVLSEKITNLVKQLGLDPEGDLVAQAISLKESLLAKEGELTEQLNKLLAELEVLNG